MRRHAGIGSRASWLAGVRQSSDATADRSNDRIHATAGRPGPTAARGSRRVAGRVDGHASRWNPSVRRRDPRAPDRASRVREVHCSSESVPGKPGVGRCSSPPATGSTSSPTPTLTHADLCGSVKGTASLPIMSSCDCQIGQHRPDRACVNVGAWAKTGLF